MPLSSGGVVYLNLKKNMRFKVRLEEVHYAIWDVDAETEAEALQKALDGDGDEGELFYSHTYDYPYIVKQEENFYCLPVSKSTSRTF